MSYSKKKIDVLNVVNCNLSLIIWPYHNLVQNMSLYRCIYMCVYVCEPIVQLFFNMIIQPSNKKLFSLLVLINNFFLLELS